MAQTLFRRSEPYKETYLERIAPHPGLRAKFRDFMEVKRNNPMQQFGSSDKFFRGGGNFINAVPGLRHAHITPDLSIVYKIVGNQIYLYGFYTHDELGTGQPSSVPRQKSIAGRFAKTQF
jgi:hypothetical protein